MHAHLCPRLRLHFVRICSCVGVCVCVGIGIGVVDIEDDRARTMRMHRSVVEQRVLSVTDEQAARERS